MNEYREVIVLKKIIIIGAGGFGRELLQWIKDINNIQSTWEIAGFLGESVMSCGVWLKQTQVRECLAEADT